MNFEIETVLGTCDLHRLNRNFSYGYPMDEESLPPPRAYIPWRQVVQFLRDKNIFVLGSKRGIYPDQDISNFIFFSRNLTKNKTPSTLNKVKARFALKKKLTHYSKDQVKIKLFWKQREILSLIFKFSHSIEMSERILSYMAAARIIPVLPEQKLSHWP